MKLNEQNLRIVYECLLLGMMLINAGLFFPVALKYSPDSLLSTIYAATGVVILLGAVGCAVGLKLRRLRQQKSAGRDLKI